MHIKWIIFDQFDSAMDYVILLIRLVIDSLLKYIGLINLRDGEAS